MKIYGDLGSGNCLKVKYTADYLGIPYEWIPVDIMKGEARTVEFAAMNPAMQTPTVDFGGGKVLAQSNAIIRYIARNSALLPDDAWTQAKIDEWLFWEQYSHEPNVATCRFHMHPKYLGKSKDTRDPGKVERGEKALDLMDGHFANTDWLAANRLTIADIALIAYTRLAHEGGFDLASRPHLRKWIARTETALNIA
ncbi:MAG: glutathione S-transferase family protein [Hyphomicrobiaceae bacterium]